MSNKKVKGKMLQVLNEAKKKKKPGPQGGIRGGPAPHATIKPYIPQKTPRLGSIKIKDPKIQKMLDGIRNAKDLTGNKKK